MFLSANLAINHMNVVWVFAAGLPLPTLQAGTCTAHPMLSLLRRVSMALQLCIECPFFTFPYAPWSWTSALMALTTQYYNDFVTFEFLKLCGSRRLGILCALQVQHWNHTAWYSILPLVGSLNAYWLNKWLQNHFKVLRDQRDQWTMEVKELSHENETLRTEY